MDNGVEKLEHMMKPTKKHRGVLLFSYFLTIMFQALMGMQLYHMADSYNNSVDQKQPWTVVFSMIIMTMRLVCLCLSVIGVFHVRITPWTIASTCTGIAYLLSIILRIYLLIYYTSSRTSAISLIVADILLNIICLLFSLILAYHSVYIHSEATVSLDMKDPYTVFGERIAKSAFSIIPGVGFFRSKLSKLAKLD